MKFTRLRLMGFKSFVEPTDFLIEPGLTGVVGPNGCGKSNLVEAMRWVMGEASHKAMRAADMDDVIFAGSGSRPGRNAAEVTMSIDNSDHTAPAAFNDNEALDISRRIEREQGSTYRINGREVRARDVQILFADASTGSRSPALVHQGRIGEIIAAKPQQRRRVLEEAAGISGLHARRHEAELRLRAAEQNLQRLEDVIGQLATQMDALKRQARQAIRYRTVAAQIRKAEATLSHLRWAAANAELAEAERNKDLTVRLVAERTGAQAEAAKRQAIAAAGLPALREAEAKAAAALHRLTVARDSLDQEEARAKSRIAELDRRLVQLGSDVERERRLVQDAESALARLLEEEETLREETHANAERRSGVDARVAEASEVLAGAEKVFAELTGAHAELSARRRQLETAERTQIERIAKLDAEIAGVERELAALEAERDRGPDVEGLAAAIEAAQAALEEAEATGQATESGHIAARQRLDAARGPLAEAERRVQRLETEAKTLAKVLAVDAKNLWPPIMDSITVGKGYEKALGAALGDDLDAPIEGSAPMRWRLTEPDGPDPALPDGVESLAQHVSGPPELMRRLAQIGVVDRADGLRLGSHLKSGQRLVSREGDLWRWDGFAAAAHAPTGAARRLAERSRLADIESELETARAAVEASREVIDAAQAEVAAAAQAETAARDRRRATQREVDTARERHAAAEREMGRTTGRLSALGEARIRLGTAHQEAVAARDEATAARAELPPTDETETRLAEVRGEIEGHRARLADVRAEAQAIAREAELSHRRLQAIASERQAWAQRQGGAGGQIESLENRIHEARTEREELEGAPEEFAAKRIGLIGEIESAEAERRAAADRLAAAEAGQTQADRDARAALEAMASSREDAVRAEERFEAAKRRLTDVAHEIQELLEVGPAEVAALAEIESDTVLPEVAQVESELDKLRRDRERLGAVNLRAEEELREVETQHTGLTTERDDLVEAIKRLRQGIQSLNREARERLLASFETVNSQFKRLFEQLFSGGTAELQLIEHDDPLEAGLEIVARPPGKKPATLSLLSGGEQALTAMALIFAVFLTNPAPICVLDEVDAPLDDHNIERFCDLLDEMKRSTDTRFIIITHNPITMARMNRLYGVTMAERGVSQLVSVDLEGAVRIREGELVA